MILSNLSFRNQHTCLYLNACWKKSTRGADTASAAVLSSSATFSFRMLAKADTQTEEEP